MCFKRPVEFAQEDETPLVVTFDFCENKKTSEDTEEDGDKDDTCLPEAEREEWLQSVTLTVEFLDEELVDFYAIEE